MRLVNARTRKLEEFVGDNIPKYAILSHTWIEGKKEVTFQEIETPEARTKPGYAKIQQASNLALADGFQYVWVDTCCIDKTSSAELSEAINSMMSWYERSEVCYAYLTDVKPGLSPSKQKVAFEKSRWFTRGWTLQELLAPCHLIFYSSDWSVISTRDDLADSVSHITGIDKYFLCHSKPAKEEHVSRTNSFNFPANDYTSDYGKNSLRAKLNSASVAQRMSWASRRQTTRDEDTAYCLLGIFDINMPLLYGEGTKAFFRLQEEIMKYSDDQSLLAWDFEGLEVKKSDRSHQSRSWFSDNYSWASDHPNGTLEYAGILATSPSAFKNCQDRIQLDVGKLTPPYSMTNKGLQLELPLSDKTDHPYALLQCQSKYAPASILAIPLKRTWKNTFVRPKLPLILVSSRLWSKWPLTTLYTLLQGDSVSNPQELREYTVIVGSLPNSHHVVDVWSSSGSWGRGSQVIIEGDDEAFASERALIKLGDATNGNEKLIIIVVVEGGPVGGIQVAYHLAEADYGWDFPFRHRHLDELKALEQENWECASETGESEDLFRDPKRTLQEWMRTLGKKGASGFNTIHTTNGVYSAKISCENSFGKKVFIIDVRYGPEPFDNIVELERELRGTIQTPLQKHLAGHRGTEWVFWLLALTPRILTIVIEFLGGKTLRFLILGIVNLKANWSPWFTAACLSGHWFFCHFQFDAFTEWVAGKPKAHFRLSRQKGLILLLYTACKLLGSDWVLDVMKNISTDHMSGIATGAKIFSMAFVYMRVLKTYPVELLLTT
ncbi:heterokaryon incompatibility protein-domain-containing protein [Biscogniauxia mediterranea]|nr:heterokaryon incompatibility protein-domain-containing protein [Biscogniauxia mediterranea]